MQQQLLTEDEDVFGGSASESENDHVSEQSDEEYEDESEMDSDLENASLNQRLLQSKGRGRPVNRLRGKHGFVWSTNVPSRQSSMLSDCVCVSV